jgi:hypothetical protein
MPKSTCLLTVILSLVLSGSVTAAADDKAPGKEPAKGTSKPATNAQPSTTAMGGVPGTGALGGGGAGDQARPKHPPFAELLKDAVTIEGLLKLYRKDDRLYAEISGNLVDKDLLVAIAIARGIGETPLVGGMTWGFGDDWIWQFRKVEDKVQIVRRNVRFTAAKGTPEERAVQLAYTDSVMFSLPVATVSPAGNPVIELSPVFMSDLPQISQVLPGFMFARDKSTWARVKAFRDNVELEVAATYASGGMARLDTVADTRGVTINVHYSLSLLPQTGYEPRLADDRVGYFVTAVKNFSRKYDSDRFVRYINRWDLRKEEPHAKLSPPKKKIIFWLEKTIPFAYRKPIQEGILEWNKAFEKAGFTNAIEVREQRPNDDFDPEDINYNTFRWITAGAGFAMGPSRVNPITGEILDADIIFDADFLSFWKDEYDILGPPRVARENPAPSAPEAFLLPERLRNPIQEPHGHYRCGCQLGHGMAAQLALGSVAAEASGKAIGHDEFDKLVYQAVKSITIHEVGHTLGLRHNFKASAYLTLEEINNPEKTKDTGLSASVMDYLPVNFMPKGQKQGDYFSTTIGPYDYWAIEYGYKSQPGGTDAEAGELKKIASRAAEPAFAYAPDEDARSIDPDPLVNRFDLGKDTIQFAKMRKELVGQLIPGLIDRVTDSGDGYQRTRRAFNMLLGTQNSAMYAASRLIGGVYENRNHKGDPGAKPPFVVTEPARQRECLALLAEQVFGEKAYDFPAGLFNLLVDSRWSHWGVKEVERADYPVREMILTWQDRILGHLLSTVVLSRLVDSEMKIPADQDVFTAAELLAGLSKATFSELDRLQQGEFTARKPAINPQRRSLQRRYLERLSNLAMGNFLAPEDCQTVAFVQLGEIETRMNAVLGGKAKLDPYTLGHLKESAARIRKVIEAKLELRGP